MNDHPDHVLLAVFDQIESLFRILELVPIRNQRFNIDLTAGDHVNSGGVAA
jgi:hypothetical protein